METITISDDESVYEANLEEEYLSPASVTNRFGGESLCERAIITRRNDYQQDTSTLHDFNEDFIEHRCKQESLRNGFQYEADSAVQSLMDLRNDISADSPTSTESDDDSIEEIFGETTDSDLKLKWTPKVLVKPSDEFEELIDEFDFGTALDWDRSNSSCLAFNSLPVLPSDTYQKAFYFNKSFLERLKRLECKDVTLELHLWPSIAKNISVACVSGPKTGKTTSYLVPLMNWFDTPEESDNQETPAIGAIVICSSTRQTYFIAQLLKLWRDPKGAQIDNKIRIISLNTSNESRQKTALFNGCDVLISTPEPLLRNMSLIDCTHTKALIIDEADVSLSLHRNAIRDIYLAYAAMKKTIKPYISNGVVYNPMAFQTMIFAERWTSDVLWFIKEVQHMPNIVFGSHYEASIALNTKCKVHVIDSENDRESRIRSIVKQLIAGLKHKPRIGIVCRDENEINYLRRQLKAEVNGLNAVVVTHQTPHYEVQRRSQIWNKCRGILFINEDAIKIVDGFQSCDCLIHYKLPKVFDTAFGDRFRLMRKVMKCYKNPMAVGVNQDSKLSTYLVVSPVDSDISKVLEYLTRLKEKIPDKLLSLFQYNRRPLCPRFAAYGNCPFQPSFCAQRHALSPSDQPIADLPTNGQIKLIISYVKGTNEFFFRLNAFRNESHTSGQWQKIEPNYDDIRSELNQLKDSAFNSLNKISTKEVYGITVRGEVLRVRLTQIKAGEALKYYETYDPKDKTEKIELFCIDFGHKIWSNMSHIFELPEHLRTLRPFAHKAYLFGIKPLDNEIDWDYRSSQKFYELVDNFRVVELTAWVLKQVNGLFWLNRLHVSKRLSNVRRKVDANPITYLMENQYVAKSEHKLPNTNTDFDTIINIWHNHRLTGSAFHSCLVDDSTYVVVSDFVSVDHFYLIQEDRVTRLQRLEDKWSASLDSKEPLKEVLVDQFCFYKYKDCQYDDISLNRAKVLAIDGDQVDVFLLDHGEFIKRAHKSCLYRILECHLKELPFQAIKVSLFGVRPIQPITYELICQLTRDENDKYRICIADKVSYADGVHKIRLYVSDNVYETHFTALSKLLVDKSCAEYINGEEDNELTLTVEKDGPNVEEENNDYMEDLEYEMANNMSVNVLGQMGLSLDEIKRDNIEAERQIAANSKPQPIASSTKSLPNPTPQMNGHSSPEPKPKAESRASKTLRRLRAIEAKKVKQQTEESDDEDEKKPEPFRPAVAYTPGEFDYTPNWSTPMFYDPSDHVDEGCDYTDEEGALEEEDLS